MSTLFRKSIVNKSNFASQIFGKFTDAVAHGSGEDFSEILHARYTVDDFGYSDDFKYWTVHGYFLDTVIPHKIAVYQAGAEMARHEWFLPFIAESKELWLDNLYLHDLSKFSANEAFGYAFHNFKSKEFDLAFERAWHHHKMHNPHHPEYYLNPSRGGNLEVLPMPKIYIAEMVADWIGAGKVYGSTLEDWLPKNLHLFRLHENTRVDLKFLLEKIGFKIDFDLAHDVLRTAAEPVL